MRSDEDSRNCEPYGSNTRSPDAYREGPSHLIGKITLLSNPHPLACAGVQMAGPRQ